jgi:hypothetical protein
MFIFLWYEYNQYKIGIKISSNALRLNTLFTTMTTNTSL